MFTRLTIRALVVGCLFTLAEAPLLAVDSDSDGLLDVIDVPQFNTSATGTIVLQGLGIEDLDGLEQLSPELFKIYLGNNRITGIDVGDLTGLNTTHLYFHDNQITDIEPGAFAGLTLRDLNLNNNHISDLHLEGGIYEVLYHLGIDRFDIKRLFLDDAQISTFSYEEIAREATEITELSMQRTTFLGDPPETLQVILEAESLDLVTVDAALYGMYEEDFQRFAAIEGNQLSIVDTNVGLADCNTSGGLDFDDLNCVTTLSERDAVLEALSLRPGDLNGDGIVVFRDFQLFVRNFGLSDLNYLQGNLDLEGVVGFDDYLILVENFGSVPSNAASAAVSHAATAAVPEPHASVLWLGAVMIAMRFRYRAAATTLC